MNIFIFLPLPKLLVAEVRSRLYVAYDIGYIQQEQFVRLLALAEEVGKLIGGLRAALSSNRSTL